MNHLVFITSPAASAPLLFWEKVKKQVRRNPGAISRTFHIFLTCFASHILFSADMCLATIVVQAPQAPLGPAMIVLDMVVFRARSCEEDK